MCSKFDKNCFQFSYAFNCSEAVVAFSKAAEEIVYLKMLQWMGGSRRKVTTSRKSTQKRQKQYFEQKKRQLEQQTARQEKYSDTTNTCTQPQINSQSLDILSLLDLSTISQEHRFNFPRAKESMEGNVLILNYQTTPSPQTMESTKVTTAHVEFKHTGASSDYQLKTIHPERVLMTSSGSHNKDLNGSDKVDRLKMINDQQLSVLDLLGDDGPNRNLEGSLGHESHVAFSVEGLGKVGAETPVHSPQQPSRYFPYGCSSPSKVTRRALSFKKFNSRLDDLAPEVDSFREYNDIPFYESELPFYSRGSVDYFSYPKQKKSVGKGFLQFNDNGPNLKTFLANEDIFFNSEDENEYMWTESSSLPDDDFLDESKCCMSWKNWPCQMDSNSAEHSNFENHVKKDITFEGLNVQNSRVCTKAG